MDKGYISGCLLIVFSSRLQAESRAAFGSQPGRLSRCPLLGVDLVAQRQLLIQKRTVSAYVPLEAIEIQNLE